VITVPPAPTVDQLLDFLEEVPVANDGPCWQHCLRKVGRVDCYDRSGYAKKGYSRARIATLARVPLFYDETGTCNCRESGRRRCTLWCRVAPAYPLLDDRATATASYEPGLHLTYSARTCIAAVDLSPRYLARTDLVWRRMVIDHGAGGIRKLARVPSWWGIRKLPPSLVREADELARELSPTWAVARDIPWRHMAAVAREVERARAPG
jgi:hypothetical protein